MKVCVVGMVYKSTTYLKFMVDQLTRFSSDSVEIKILANDPTKEVEQELPNCGLPFKVRKDEFPNAFYLEKVYRGWNECVSYANSDLVILVNSDMGYSNGWDTSLIKSVGAAKNRFVVSRLVESGKMPSGKYGLSKDFGKSPETYDEKSFLNFADQVKENKLLRGGLYSPVCMWGDKFLASGGFPEGNVGGVPGDIFAFIRCGMSHFTDFNSVVYHIQEGEMDEPQS